MQKQSPFSLSLSLSLSLSHLCMWTFRVATKYIRLLWLKYCLQRPETWQCSVLEFFCLIVNSTCLNISPTAKVNVLHQIAVTSGEISTSYPKLLKYEVTYSEQKILWECKRSWVLNSVCLSHYIGKMSGCRRSGKIHWQLAKNQY